MTSPVVGFAGMTHLGLVSSSATAARGFELVCFDPDHALIRRLARQDMPILEPGLNELIHGNGARQRFTSARRDLEACDIVYVAPDVPTDEEGRSDVSGLTALIRDVSAAMDPRAVMVVLSQVPPGYTRALGAWPLERLYYQVETLVFGQAVERALKPERIIVGCCEPVAALEARFRTVLDAFGCPILPMRYESAELAKISINCCLVGSVTVANTLAEVCEKVGADWSEIVPALKLDRRIGAYAYIAPGLGIAGGNLERDLATVQRLSEARGTEAGLMAAWRRNSRYRRDWPLRQLHERIMSRINEPVVAILGVTYKENTHSIKNSPAVALITELVPSDIAARLRGRVVVDPFSMLDRAAAVAAGLEHIVLGAPVPVHPE